MTGLVLVSTLRHETSVPRRKWVWSGWPPEDPLISPPVHVGDPQTRVGRDCQFLASLQSPKENIKVHSKGQRR